MEKKNQEIEQLKQQLKELKKKYDGLKTTKEYENRSFQVKREILSIAEFQQLRNQHPIAMEDNINAYGQYAYQLNDVNTANYKMHFADMEGNIVDTLYFVPSIFTVTRQTVASYVDGLDGRLTPMECVVNALQFLGVFDAYTANMLRMTYVGAETGYNRKQLEMALMLWDTYTLKYNYNMNIPGYENVMDNEGYFLPHLFDVVKIGNFDEWSYFVNRIFRGTVNHHENYAANGVDGNPALLCWWSEATTPTRRGGAHAFVMLKNSDNQIVIIDPMLREPWCNFSHNDDKCVAMLTENAADNRIYHIVANSATRLTDPKQLEYFGFKLDDTVRQTPFKQMIRIIDLDYGDEHIGTSGCGDHDCSAANALLGLNPGNEEISENKATNDAKMDGDDDDDDDDEGL